MKRGIIFRSALIGAGLASLVLAAPVFAQDAGKPAQEETQTRKQTETKKEAAQKWDTQAESAFGLGRGMGRKLMTSEEWQEHRKKMRSMSPQEREQYRKEVHAKMMERAKEKGITMPEQPGGGGMGPGGGMGGGMGPGGKR